MTEKRQEKLRSYPKIRGSHKAPFKECIAFVKYDGSNLHWTWKDGEWVHFGTRRARYPYTEEGKREFNRKHEMLSACPVFAESLRPILSNLFQEHFPGSVVIAFTEYLGDRSFAGSHKADDDMRLVLFDVSVDGVFLLPQDFLDIFAEVPHVAKVVYKGKLNGQFLDDVRSGKYDLDEGVVCKGVTMAWEGALVPWMVKVKTNGYMEKLKAKHGSKWLDFWE